MENVVLIVHLILALCLIAVVLLQRSEGGGLGMGGGGGGGGGVMSGRAAATALGKLTWAFAIAFICTSIALTILAAMDSAGGSVVDRFTPAPATQDTTIDGDTGMPAGSELLPPSGDSGNAPLLPRAD
ncbi:MAG: preprotein translocase subunit SecG [Celeribacter sp.]|jgi:preprotein translocase subunit SecG